MFHAPLQSFSRARNSFAVNPSGIAVSGIAIIDVLSASLWTWDDVGRKQAAREPNVLALDEDQELERQIALERIVDTVANYDDDFALAVLGGEDVPEFRPQISLEEGMQRIYASLVDEGRIPESEPGGWEDRILAARSGGL